MDAREARLVEVLEALGSMFIEAGRSAHPMIEQLLDPSSRRSDATLNYLTATASGTPQDQEFSAFNGDREPAGGYDAFNRRYRQLVDEAAELAAELGLPAARQRAR